MEPRFQVGIIALLIIGARTLNADGLSWTDPNTDTLCDHKTLLVCSKATIHLVDSEVAGTKVQTLSVLLTLSPRESPADNVSFQIVVETSDHVKHSYEREKVPIKVYESDKPGSFRYCNPAFGMPLDTGVVAVLAMDAQEENAKGDIVARHAFR